MSDDVNVKKPQDVEAAGSAEGFLNSESDILDEEFNDSEILEGNEEVSKQDVTEDSSVTVTVAAPSSSGKGREYNKKSLSDLASEFTINMYRYAADVRHKGHATLADMIFRDSMAINLAANMASAAIGRDKFIQCLEDGYYASGRVFEYLKFAALCGVGSKNQGELMEAAETIHKIYAVSIKTATGKNKKNSNVYM